MKRHQQSILITGIPLERGARPIHFEHTDETAFTGFNGRDGSVREVHTPPDSLRRIHELMHARHSRHDAEGRKVYRGIYEPVRQVVEDCRIHLKHWPWRAGISTPPQIARDARTFVAAEVKRVLAKVAALPAEKKADGAWPAFAIKIRAACVAQGIDGNLHSELRRLFANVADLELAKQACDFLLNDCTRTAARIIQSAFFDPPEETETDREPAEEGEGDADGEEEEEGDSEGEEGENSGIYTKDCKMQVIELPHTETIQEATTGTRVATSGSRIFRPALRRPVLPARMFVRRSIVEPAGTILVDASGSMGSFALLEELCKASPFATVAYYAGNGRDGGWLYVYARGGMRAKEAIEPDGRDNTIDGLALDWLLKQDAPRVMVTDRGFCDVADSTAQAVRLERLEQAGLLTVREYEG